MTESTSSRIAPQLGRSSGSVRRERAGRRGSYVTRFAAPVDAGGSCAGVTLLEMLLVIFILSIVLGTGLGMFASLDLGRGQAASSVRSVIRAVQNTTMTTQAPGRVRIDKAAGTLTPEVVQVVGTWHFEDKKLAGGNDLVGTVRSELFVPDGFIGDALDFRGQVGEKATIPVDLDPAFDLRDGFVIDCYIRQEDTGGGRILRISDHIELALGDAGKVRGAFTAKLDRDAKTGAATSQRGGNVIVQSATGAVTPERWTRITLSYDRRELLLLVDGVVVDARPETAAVWDIESGLELSDERRPFPGSVDSLVISAVVASDAVVLPDTVTIADAPEVIYFAAGGGLDRKAHRDPPVIVLAYDDGEREALGIGFYGTVE